MRKTQTIIGEEVRPANPSARRYYVWQAAMWFTILHMALIGMAGTFDFGINDGVKGFAQWNILTRGGPIHLNLASFLRRSPSPAILACFMLVPVAVIACYRASMGKRAWVWLIAYWVLAATVGGIMVSSHAVYWFRAYEGPVWRWLRPGLFFCFCFLSPLPVTVLAALVTIERRKRPPALEAGA